MPYDYSSRSVDRHINYEPTADEPVEYINYPSSAVSESPMGLKERLNRLVSDSVLGLPYRQEVAIAFGE